MDKFIIGFALGLALGAAAVILLSPSPETEARARLRVRTERFASGEETPVSAVKGFADSQRNKLEEAGSSDRVIAIRGVGFRLEGGD